MSIKHISRIIILTLMVMLGVKSSILIVNASAGVRAESGVSKTNTSSRSLDKQKSFTPESVNVLMKVIMSEDYKKGVLDEQDLITMENRIEPVIQCLISEDCTRGNGIDKDLRKKLKEYYDKMKLRRKLISQKKQELEDHQELLRISNSKFSSSQDYFHQREANIMKKYGVSQEEAHKMIESGDPRSDIVWKEMVDAKMQQDLAQLRARRSHIKNNESRKE